MMMMMMMDDDDRGTLVSILLILAPLLLLYLPKHDDCNDIAGAMLLSTSHLHLLESHGILLSPLPPSKIIPSINKQTLGP